MEDHVRFAMFFNFFPACYRQDTGRSMSILLGNETIKYGVISREGKNDPYGSGRSCS